MFNSNSVVLSKILSMNPLLVYTLNLPQPTELVLTQYEHGAFPAVIGNLLSLSISSVQPLFRVGRVYSFDVLPRNNTDPIFVYSPIGDLKNYYRMWKNIITNGVDRKGKAIKEYDDAICTFARSSFGLEPDEIMFAMIEMLKFKNDVVMNPNMMQTGFFG